jgi:hypothetical protein
MSKKLISIGTVVAIAFAVAIVAAGDHSAVACDGNAKASTASATANCSSASAASLASSSGCSKSTAAVASAASCNKTASARVASSSSCNKSANVVVAGYGCNKSAAKTAGSGCSASSKVASGDCCDARNAVAGYTKKASEETPQEHATALKEIVDVIPAGNNKRLVLTGSMECGSCSHHATAACAPLLKTSDGKIYPLINNQLVSKMRHDESAKNGFEVSTRVKKLYGVKYLDVVAYKTL